MILATLVVGVWLVKLIAWRIRRAPSEVDRWAAENGYRLISKEYRWFLRGSFAWDGLFGETVVYHVRVEDREGRVRRAYVGVRQDGVSAKWDD